MKKEDLKVGYLVKARNETLWMVMPIMVKDEGLILVSKKGGWEALSDFNDSLELTDDGNFDIMKVWGHSLWACRVFDFDPEDRELLWERKEETLYFDARKTLDFKRGHIMRADNPHLKCHGLTRKQMFEQGYYLSDDLFTSVKPEPIKIIGGAVE